MMYFWSFFLLAFVTNLVHSDVNISNEHLKNECSKVINENIDKLNLNLGDLSTFASVLLKSFFQSITLSKNSLVSLKLSTTDKKFSLKLSINSMLGCVAKSESLLDITVDISLFSSQNKDCNCNIWKFDKKTASIQIKFIGDSTPGLDLLLKQIHPIIRECLLGLVDLVVQKLNTIGKLLTTPRTSCGKECSWDNYALTPGEKSTTLNGCCLPAGSEETCEAQEPTPITTPDIVWITKFTSSHLKSLLQLSIKNLQIKTSIVNEISSLLHVPIEYGLLYLHITFEDLSDCSYKSDGAEISLVLDVSVCDAAGKRIITAKASLKAKLNIHTKNHCLGLQLSDSIKIELTSEPTDDEKCECKIKGKQGIIIALKNVLGVIKAKLDCICGCIHPLPRLGAKPSCEHGDGSCQCVGKKQ